MFTSSLLEVIHELRAVLKSVDFNALSTLVKSAPRDLEKDSAQLEKLLEILTKLSEHEKTISSSDTIAFHDGIVLPCDIAGESREVPYVIIGRSKGVENDVYSTYNALSDRKEEDDAASALSDDSVEFDEVKISDSAFPELYPTREATMKRELPPKSFPNIGNFRGGIHVLGSGNFGYTFKSMLRGVPVVLKVSKTRGEASNRADYHEWSVSEKLKPHPNVLQIIGLCPSFALPLSAEIGTTALIAPLKENGGLREFFDRRVPRDGDIVDIAIGMIAGIRSLHEQRVVHRDIAVRNFLVDCDGRVLICDFGLTESLPDGQDTFCGSPDEALPWRNIAPESSELVFSTKSDIWMYGLALLELVSKQMPWSKFKRFSHLKKAFKAKELVFEGLDLLPPLIANIVRDCCQIDPSDRPTANDIMLRLVLWELNNKGFPLEQSNPGDALALASRRGLLVAVKILARAFPNHINELSNLTRNKLTPLYFAVEQGHIDVVKFLASLPNIDPSVCNNSGFTPLHLAAAERNTDVVKVLLTIPNVDPNAQSNYGNTPLHLATESGFEDVVEILLKSSNIDPNVAEKDGLSPLHIATRKRHANIVMTLLTLPHIDPNVRCNNGKTPLYIAVESDFDDIVDILLTSSNVDSNAAEKEGLSPLHIATRKYHAHIVMALLTLPNIDPNARCNNVGKTPLHLASESGFDEIVEALLALPNIDPNARCNNGKAPLHFASESGFDEIVEVLLALPNIDPNARCNNGKTPLHLASESGFDKIVEVLLALPSIDPNVRCDNGKTPLQLATERGFADVVEVMLTSQNVDPSATNKNNWTLLHTAAGKGYSGVVKALLTSPKIDPNACDNSCLTPMHAAAERGRDDVVGVLLTSPDIDLNVVTTTGHKAADIARDNGFVELADRLEIHAWRQACCVLQ